MKPTIKKSYRNTYHRDGTVSHWNVYQQQWIRCSASAITPLVLASMNSGERMIIANLSAKS